MKPYSKTKLLWYWILDNRRGLFGIAMIIVGIVFFIPREISSVVGLAFLIAIYVVFSIYLITEEWIH